jgi:hypothetical protein
VIVAVLSMRVVQMTADQVVRVVAVRHLLVPAIRAVNMSTIVARAFVVGRAGGWVSTAQIDRVLVHVVAVHEVHMPVVQVVDVTVVLDSRMPAIRTVGMAMGRVFVTGHGSTPFGTS